MKPVLSFYIKNHFLREPFNVSHCNLIFSFFVFTKYYTVAKIILHQGKFTASCFIFLYLCGRFFAVFKNLKCFVSAGNLLITEWSASYLCQLFEFDGWAQDLKSHIHDVFFPLEITMHLNLTLDFITANDFIQIDIVCFYFWSIQQDSIDGQ